MANALPMAAAVLLIGALAPSVADARQRATVSPMNLADRYGLPQALRGDVSRPQWLAAPRPQWPDEAGDVARPVTVTSECAVSRAGSLKDCRITAESVPDRGFGPAFLRALADARVGTGSLHSPATVFRTTATFDPPAAGPGL